jgi:nucleotide-binding universal stress UspA family protein
MKTFGMKKIIAPIDFSEIGLLAINKAAFLAKICNGHLFLLQGIKTPEYSYNGDGSEMKSKEAEDFQEELSKKVDQLIISLQSQYGINISSLINEDALANGMNKVCKEKEIDLAVMGTHNKEGIQELLVGSNADRVLNNSVCPLITIKDASNSGLANIVMPIDNSPHSRQKIDYVIEIARYTHSTIHILGLLDSLDKSDQAKLSIKLDSTEVIIKKAKLPYIRKLVVTDNIAKEAMKYSEKVDADLLVIMTDRDESRLSDSFLAKHVINHSRVPVMSIRPVEHYVTYGGMFAN